tara:strand:- start:182 stop:436 length:255 start_codon:yes stop_codon:yes gene_type:complete
MINITQRQSTHAWHKSSEECSSSSTVGSASSHQENGRTKRTCREEGRRCSLLIRQHKRTPPSITFTVDFEAPTAVATQAWQTQL